MLYVAAVLPAYSPALGYNARMRDDIIENYFNLGLTAPEIALFLVSVHGIGISLRQTQTACRFTWISWVTGQLSRKKVASKSQESRK